MWWFHVNILSIVTPRNLVFNTSAHAVFLVKYAKSFLPFCFLLLLLIVHRPVSYYYWSYIYLFLIIDRTSTCFLLLFVHLPVSYYYWSYIYLFLIIIDRTSTCFLLLIVHRPVSSYYYWSYIYLFLIIIVIIIIVYIFNEKCSIIYGPYIIMYKYNLPLEIGVCIDKH